MTDQQRILIVDDEYDICDILSFNLRAAGFQVAIAHSAQEALDLEPAGYHLVLLDVMMPEMTGFELARQLKADAHTSHIPVIFLTAKDSEEDTLYGFQLGADDYVEKPFSIREVTARVKAVLTRHLTAPPPSPILTHARLSVNSQTRQVHIDGRPIPLTKTEFELLYLLMSHPEKVYSREALLKEVWPSDVIVTHRTADVNIARLRKKLGVYAACIGNKQGYGYFFTPTYPHAL